MNKWHREHRHGNALIEQVKDGCRASFYGLEPSTGTAPTDFYPTLPDAQVGAEKFALQRLPPSQDGIEALGAWWADALNSPLQQHS